MQSEHLKVTAPAAPTTDKQRYALDPTRKWASRHKGIRFRVKADGSRVWLVHHKGKWIAAGPREADALEKQAEYRKALARGEAPVIDRKVTFGELGESWYEAKKERLRWRTATDYRAALDLVLLPRFGSRRLVAIDADAISRLVRDLQKEGLHAIDPKRPVRPLGHSATENYLKPLRGVMALAVRRRLISSNPFDVLTSDDLPVKGEKRAIYVPTEDEFKGLLDGAARNAEKKEAKCDYTPLLRLTGVLGLRQGEALGLQWQDFDKDESTLTIARQWGRNGAYGPVKTKAGCRRIALPAALRDELIALRLRSNFSRDDHPVYASRSGTPLTHRNVTRRGFEAARDEAGLPKHLTFHDLRHYCASRLIAGRLDPVTVASILGHEDASITLRIYAHLFDRQRTDEAVRAALTAGGAS